MTIRRFDELSYRDRKLVLSHLHELRRLNVVTIPMELFSAAIKLLEDVHDDLKKTQGTLKVPILS